MLSDVDIITAHPFMGFQMAPLTRRSYCAGPGCDWHEDLPGATPEEVRRLHAAHVAAMLRDNRTLHTVEDIVALPDGTWISDSDGLVGQIGDNADAADYLNGDAGLPVAVLWHPFLDGGIQ